MSEIDDALKFFKNEIYQTELMLGGILSPEYVSYLRKKMSYYKIAVNSIGGVINKRT